MTGGTVGSGTVAAFPRLVADAVARRQGDTGQQLCALPLPSKHRVDRQPRRSWRVSSVGDATLRWIVHSVLLGLAYAAAAHGPVSPDMLHEVLETDRRRPRL